jgi:hypothetical protein
MCYVSTGRLNEKNARMSGAAVTRGWLSNRAAPTADSKRRFFFFWMLGFHIPCTVHSTVHALLELPVRFQFQARADRAMRYAHAIAAGSQKRMQKRAVCA